MAKNPNSDAAVMNGQRLASLRKLGFIDAAALPLYRKSMRDIYGPRLREIGFDPAAGAHAVEASDVQALRVALVELVGAEAHDDTVRLKLDKAGRAYIGGDNRALDQSFIGQALGGLVETDGLPMAKQIVDRALASEDITFRRVALAAAAGSGNPEIAQWLLALDDNRLRSVERIDIVVKLAAVPSTAELATDWMIANFDRLAGSDSGRFLVGRLPKALADQCSAESAQRIQTALRPKVVAQNLGLLSFERALENIRHCSLLKSARSSEVSRAFSAP